jgi:hypothetical protein
MVYITLEGTTVLQLAGEAVNEEMLAEGYVGVEAEVPDFDPAEQYLEYDNDVFTVKDIVKSQEELNTIAQKFMDDTDWKVLRHLRQVTLEIDTTLTEEEYLDLEAERDAVALSINHNYIGEP